MLAGLVPAVAARAADPPGPAALVNACQDTAGQVPEAGPRGCRSLQALVWGAGQLCRLPDAQNAACASVDGRDLTEAAMAAYESSWTHQALALQRELDARVPLLRALVPHTHNSFNSAAYPPTLSGADANQAVSLTDQLRLDMRAIEIDVHWAPSPTGDPSDGGMAPIMCHGEPVGVGPETVHAGCTVERHLRDGLAELRSWLDAEDAAGRPQLVVLYLENALDNDPVAHAAAARTIDAELGRRVLRPPAGQPCAQMPLDTTRQQILDAGHRVLIVGNCGPGAWGAWVHERGPRWDESSSGPGNDYPGLADCAAERAAVDYDHNWIRRYEDSTWLSAMAGGASSEVTIEETRAMVRCGVNMPGFDQLRAGDRRLSELVWSWAEGTSLDAQGADCAAQDADARFRGTSCSSRLRFACVDGVGAWHVTSGAGKWDKGQRECQLAFPGSRFAVPANGYENSRLRAAAPVGGSVWLDYRRVGGDWTPGSVS
ncbi:MAG: hypothetical protein QOG87_332 [Actinomycetota bacterium]